MEREDCRVCKCLKVPGFCFKPSDEQLLAYYLTAKIEGRTLPCNHIVTELKIYDDDLMPWEIVKDDNPYWRTSSSNKKTIYVFTELRKKGTRVIRRSGHGSWTSQHSFVVKNEAGNGIGYNRLLTFYKDKDDKKVKKKIADGRDHEHWIMHEYSLFGIDNYVLCKIIKEVKFSSKASLCPTKTAAKQDFHSQVDAQIRNIDSDNERQLDGGDQTIDESTTDWDKNGWNLELNELLEADLDGIGRNTRYGTEISDDTSAGVGVAQELPVVAVMDDPQQQHDWDKNGWNAELNELLGADLDGNCWNTRYGTEISDDTSDAGVSKEFPVVAVMDDPQQGHDFPDSSLVEETVAFMQELPVAVCEKNIKRDGSYKCLVGAGNHNIIVLDDDTKVGVEDAQELMTTEAADAPRFEAITVGDEADYNMEWDKNIPDDFWNFKIVEDATWNGTFDVPLDFSSPDLFDLLVEGTNGQSSTIQPLKRMRHGEEAYKECPSGKKQRFIST